MATIRDVARAAGVSITTVSAVLNSTGRVSEETRRMVWDAVGTVGYSPNAIARSLRLGKSRLIGMIVTDITNPFSALMIRTVARSAYQAGYSVIVSDLDDDPSRARLVIDQLRSQHVAGILMTPAGCTLEQLERLHDPDAPPLVTIDQWVEGLRCDFVGIDNRAVVQLLVGHLVDLGHRRIAMISGREGIWTADERLAAFVEALDAAAIDVDPLFCRRADYGGKTAFAAGSALLSLPRRPTAIIGANNLIALGALEAAVEHGLGCPEEISIAGIDDVPWGRLVRPRITTAAQPIQELAGTAIDWLLERIAAGDQGPPQRQKLIQPVLVEGQSCAAPAPLPEPRARSRRRSS